MLLGEGCVYNSFVVNILGSISNISLRLSSNSEAKASELLKSIENCFFSTTCKVVCAQQVKAFNLAIMCTRREGIEHINHI